ncbi:MAG: V-type ATPase subunit, partial [Clostridiales bacterium]|nr:V-type ATPase subunit [Clostridiales bacterium]
IEKKSTGEVAAYLKEHVGWSELLRDVDISDIHRLRLESELDAALYGEYRRIISFIPFEGRHLLHYPVIQAEVSQILSAIRNLSVGAAGKPQYGLPMKTKYKTDIDIGALAAAQNYPQLLDALRNTDYNIILQRFKPQEGKTVDYPAVELALDAYFYNRLFNLAGKAYAVQTRRKLRNMYGEYVDVVNITRTLRLRRYFPDSAGEISMYLIPVYYKIKPEFLYDLVKMTNKSSALAALSATPYGKYFGNTDYKYIESYHDRYLAKLYTHLIHAPSADLMVPVSYLNYKQLEIRNLIHIVECVHYGVPAKTVLPYLITPERR